MTETLRQELITDTMLMILADCGYAMMPGAIKSAISKRLRTAIRKGDYNAAYWITLDAGLIRRLKDGQVKITTAGKQTAKHILAVRNARKLLGLPDLTKLT